MNINEIAHLAGVSRATVSRYLNDGYVSDEKKKKIKAVIEITGYKPSASAQMLRSRKTKLVGVIIPRIESESIGEMVSGINHILTDNDYRLLLADTENNEDEEIKYLDLFRANQVDGVILIGTTFTPAHYKALNELEVPVIILGQKVDGYSCVYNDDFGAARDIATQLVKDCQENVGYIGVNDRNQALGYNRKQGFIKALENKGIAQNTKLWMSGEFTIESGYRCAGEMFAIKEDIEAIFCATDKIALGAMMYLKQRNISIPSQIKICGLGDSIYGRTSAVGLSTVHFNYKESGCKAAKLLVEDIDNHLAGEEISKHDVMMGYELVIRESI